MYISKVYFSNMHFSKVYFFNVYFSKVYFSEVLCEDSLQTGRGCKLEEKEEEWEPDRLSNKLHSTKLLLLLNKLKNTFSNAISFAAPYIHMILPHLVINWIPAIATGHSHTSVGSSNNLHSFAKAAATAAAAAAQCIKVLLHEHYSSSSYAIRCILHLHTHLHTFNAFLSRSSRSYC